MLVCSTRSTPRYPSFQRKVKIARKFGFFFPFSGEKEIVVFPLTRYDLMTGQVSIMQMAPPFHTDLHATKLKYTNWMYTALHRFGKHDMVCVCERICRVSSVKILKSETSLAGITNMRTYLPYTCYEWTDRVNAKSRAECFGRCLSSVLSSWWLSSKQTLFTKMYGTPPTALFWTT